MDHLALHVPEQLELEDWARHLDELGIEHSGVKRVPYEDVITLRDPHNIPARDLLAEHGLVGKAVVVGAVIARIESCRIPTFPSPPSDPNRPTSRPRRKAQGIRRSASPHLVSERQEITVLRASKDRYPECGITILAAKDRNCPSLPSLPEPEVGSALGVPEAAASVDASANTPVEVL